ncbi:hypothetical protein PVL30_004599 [Lodderomyces elongisporus]|uniref:uncharacterized protein n=1 Tax=Lodderomyces elongisporus TaxID=36914 RepID=UPI00291CEF0B|nr:uncharacterized protein PVL30_004599 [Lodderomyces elongisporus]WLF80810.1 hypothetical protein PVL30_004599 [Lodderomyces elongisporus]
MSMDKFESILKELAALPPPGVSGNRIKALVEISLTDFDKEKESKVIAALYSSCKASPSLNKLGTLYVVDAIARRYKDEALAQGQTIDANAEDGTFASAVYKISELIESILDDAMEYQINPSVRLKISKLLDIWEKHQTFDQATIKRMKDKHFKSTTPPGTPPKTSVEPTRPSSKSEDSSSILSALTSLAQGGAVSNSTNSNADAAASILSSTTTLNPGATGGGSSSSSSISNNNNGDNNAENILSRLSALAGNAHGNNIGHQQPASATANGSVSGPAAPSFGGAPGTGQDVLNMLQQMRGAPAEFSSGRSDHGRFGSREQHQHQQQQGRRNRSRSPVRGARSPPSIRSPPATSSVFALQQNMQNLKQQQQQAAAASASSTSSGTRSQGYQSPSHMYQQPYQQQQQQQQQQHQSSYGQQNRNSHQNPAFASPSDMGGEMNLPGTPHYRPRNVSFDPTLPQGTIKVLSRTLFLGGVPRNMDQRMLTQVLRPFADVQSVVLNSDKKIAFVKVYSRKEAEQVIMSFNKDNSLPLRTRWGVGFGPRDCCNYQNGVSIIPIDRLTEADKTWFVSAQWGGTGGQPMASGMVVDEPDIEIGAGISSKAMSRKMPTNSARNGPKSNRPGEPDDAYARTTLLQPQGPIQMSHGDQPQFNTFQQSSVNPLQNLFGNASANGNGNGNIGSPQTNINPLPQFPGQSGGAQQPYGFQGAPPLAASGYPQIPGMANPADMPPEVAKYFMQALQQQQQQQQQHR